MLTLFYGNLIPSVIRPFPQWSKELRELVFILPIKLIVLIGTFSIVNEFSNGDALTSFKCDDPQT